MKPQILLITSENGALLAQELESQLAPVAQVTAWRELITPRDLLTLLVDAPVFHFGVFVFTEKDISSVFRELLYCHKVFHKIINLAAMLGKQYVYYLAPEGWAHAKWPVEEVGMPMFLYDRKCRDTETMLTPFCQAIEMAIQEHQHAWAWNLQNEAVEIQKIIKEKPARWEWFFLYAKLARELKKVQCYYSKVDRNRKFCFENEIALNNLYQWAQHGLADLMRDLALLSMYLTVDMKNALGSSGAKDDLARLKKCADDIAAVANRIFAWQHKVQCIVLPEKAAYISELMQAISSPYIRFLDRLPEDFIRHAEQSKRKNAEEYTFIMPNISVQLQTLFWSINNLQTGTSS